MDFDDALRYLHGRVRFGVKLGNDRFLALLGRLGNPQSSLSVVHIAGTKGKGSTAVMAASILQSAGYRTGVYLSPYVYDVRERVQIDGEMIARVDFAQWVDAIKPHVEALEATELGPTTEFELKTAIGFCYFAEQNVEYAVIEVGLGGRLDATNVIESPLVTAITTIGYDHVELLGPTLTDIAREKAGIVKKGIVCVTAVTVGSEPYAEIARICEERHAPLLTVSAEDGVQHAGDIAYGTAIDGSLRILTALRCVDGIRPRLQGSFQHANAATAVGALDAIPAARRPAISDQQIRDGLGRAYLPGRLEVIARRPTVIVDGAHNELSARALATALRENELPGRELTTEAAGEPRRLILVVGLSRNHAPGPFLEPLLALRPVAVIAAEPSFHPRDARETAAVAAGAKVDHVRVVTSGVANACREALTLATPNDIVCLTGSFYTLGDVPPDLWRKLLKERNFAHAS